MADESAASMKLEEKEKEFLREIARQAVAAAVQDLPRPDTRRLASEAGIDLAPRLTARRGAFVTLTRAGKLRGCIGYIEGVKPLVEAVVDNGRSAAVGDPRFPPVSTAELAEIHIEISALTPLVPVAGPEEITIGRHGVVLAKDGRRAVFLPQVATEQGWDRDTTLEQLAL
jgi:AmmeMemoRadiSam system protein A